jgi:hypothetical protein
MAKTDAERARAARERRAVSTSTEFIAAQVRIEGLEALLAAWKRRALDAEEALAGGPLRPRTAVTNRDVTDRHDRDEKPRHETVTDRHAPASPRLARGDLVSLSDPSFSAPSTAYSERGRESSPPSSLQEGRTNRDVTDRHDRDEKPRHETVTEANADPVVEELEQGADLYPDEELEPLANRIRRAVLAEPCAARDGITPAIAAMEGVAYARQQLGHHPHMPPTAVLAAVEKHVLKHVLGDCRKGERRKREPSPLRPLPSSSRTQAPMDQAAYERESLELARRAT